MNIAHVQDPTDPRLDAYRCVRDADLLGRHGVFMAEGRFVVHTLLTASPYRCRSVLVTPVALDSIQDALNAADPALPVYVVDQALMNSVAGFDIHRGCLAIGERPAAQDVEQITAPLAGAARGAVVVLENLTNHDNVGGIFRSALALGASGVVLSPSCCDPLYRKAIRVSMGAALRLPFAVAPRWPAALDDLLGFGFEPVALTTAPGAVDLRDLAADPARPRRIALVVGTEGGGLSEEAVSRCRHRVRIGMTPGVDSLNAGVAAALALHALGPLAEVPPPRR